MFKREFENKGKGEQAPNSQQETSTQKIVRQETRGVALSRMVEANGKIMLNIRPEIGKPICVNSTRFATECGIIVRNFAPLKVNGWHNIRKEDKEPLFHRLRERFDINLNLPHVRKSCNDIMGIRFRDFRHKCYKHFQQYSTLDQAIKSKYKKRMRDDDWEWLCNHFNSDEFKRKSERNKNNHKHLRYNHYCGTKSMLAHRESKRNIETGIEQSRIDLFFDTHYKQGKGWISEQAEADYMHMRELQVVAQAQML